MQYTYIRNKASHQTGRKPPGMSTVLHRENHKSIDIKVRKKIFIVKNKTLIENSI